MTRAEPSHYKRLRTVIIDYLVERIDFYMQGTGSTDSTRRYMEDVIEVKYPHVLMKFICANSDFTAAIGDLLKKFGPDNEYAYLAFREDGIYVDLAKFGISAEDAVIKVIEHITDKPFHSKQENKSNFDNILSNFNS